MEKTKITVGDWKFVRMDSLNWQVHHRREIKANNKTERGGEVDWMAMPAFFGKLADAVAYARNHAMDEGGDYADVDTFLKELRRADAEFLRGLKAALTEASKHDLTEVGR